MALISRRPFADALLSLNADNTEHAHIFEPEFHQDIYRLAGENAKVSPGGAYQLGDDGILVRYPNRGKQPDYVDDLDDPNSILYVGKLMPGGRRLTSNDTTNIAALKSISVRGGYVDLDSARCVSDSYFAKYGARTSVQRGDVLINSTGDGTIGRVAVYHFDLPAVVDGHITILRFNDLELAWYSAAYLLTASGQNQLYRYINGSSGQVEIYPQDIARIWIPRATAAKTKKTANLLKDACLKFESFQTLMSQTLASAEDIS